MGSLTIGLGPGLEIMELQCPGGGRDVEQGDCTGVYLVHSEALYICTANIRLQKGSYFGLILYAYNALY